MSAGALRVDHYVKSADGTVYRVAWLDVPRGEAELVEIDDGHARVTLPIGELKRVPNPFNKRPPIEGLPTERPRCAWCDRKLRPHVIEHYDREQWPRKTLRRVFNGWRSIEGVFDTNRCAIAFGGASWRGGYRRKR